VNTVESVHPADGHRHLDAAPAVERGWLNAGRVVSMAAGGGTIGTLAGPAGAGVGAVIGGLAGLIIAAQARSRHASAD
jgi:hypothetical protein